MNHLQELMSGSPKGTGLGQPGNLTEEHARFGLEDTVRYWSG